jgi:hypothetical protein
LTKECILLIDIHQTRYKHNTATIGKWYHSNVAAWASMVPFQGVKVCYVDQIQLARDTVQWQTLVNVEVNKLLASTEVRKFF